MNQRVTAILLVALLVSAGASFVVYRVVTSRAPSGAPTTTAQVVMAARNLEIGTLIKDVDFKFGPWTGPMPKGLITKKEGLVGRGVIAPIYEGEPIMETRLAPPGAGGGLAATIPAGMRACAVKVNEIVGVAGFVVPGMRVDVLISGTPPGRSNAGPLVRTLLQNIEVLSAGQNYQKDAEGKPVLVPVVNLLVNPEQAEVLSLASNETRIQLVLRNPLDNQVAKVPGSGITNLFGAPAKLPALVASAPRTVKAVMPKAPVRQPEKVIVLAPYQIEVFNGPRRTEATFPRRSEEKQ
jgi:pilus assembly protein CpaB